MKTIIKYQAIDGREFKTEDECVKYETLIDDVNLIMSELPKTPKDDNCSFANGKGFIQHDKNKLRSVKIKLLNEIKKYVNHDWIEETIKDETVHPSYVGRILYDCNIRPLSDAWYRIQCIDNKQREWGQPYFAYNPTKGEQIKLN